MYLYSYSHHTVFIQFIVLSSTGPLSWRPFPMRQMQHRSLKHRCRFKAPKPNFCLAGWRVFFRVSKIIHVKVWFSIAIAVLVGDTSLIHGCWAPGNGNPRAVPVVLGCFFLRAVQSGVQVKEEAWQLFCRSQAETISNFGIQYAQTSLFEWKLLLLLKSFLEFFCQSNQLKLTNQLKSNWPTWKPPATATRSAKWRSCVGFGHPSSKKRQWTSCRRPGGWQLHRLQILTFDGGKWDSSAWALIGNKDVPNIPISQSPNQGILVSLKKGSTETSHSMFYFSWSNFVVETLSHSSLIVDGMNRSNNNDVNLGQGATTGHC